MPTNNASVKHAYYTRAKFDLLTTKDTNTYYTVLETNGTLSMYLGATPYKEYVLPQATSSVLGGIKADTKTTLDTVPIKIETSTGKLFSTPNFIEMTCNTAIGTVAKTITLSGLTLTAGQMFSIKFANGNSANSPTLNINGTGAKPIKLGGQNPTSASGTGGAYVSAGGYMYLHYDGTNFNMMGSTDITDANTTYSAITPEEIEIGTATTSRSITAKVLKDELNKKVKRVNLGGQLQVSDFRKSVIALVDVDNTNISRDSYSIGTLTFHRYNGNDAPIKVDFAMEKRYNVEGVNYLGLSLIKSSSNVVRPCTFTYNGKKYGGLEVYFQNSTTPTISFYGETNFEIFALDYYNTSSNTAINTEVNNSINFTTNIYNFEEVKIGNKYLATQDWVTAKNYLTTVPDLPISKITNLQTSLDNKQNKLTAGSGITISGNTISATGGGGVEPIKSGSFQTGIPIGDYSKYSIVVVNFSFSGFLWSHTMPLPDTTNGTKESYVAVVDAGMATQVKVTLTTTTSFDPSYSVLTVNLSSGTFSSVVII